MQSNCIAPFLWKRRDQGNLKPPQRFLYFVHHGPQQFLASQLGWKDNGKERQLGVDRGDLIIEPGPFYLLACPHMSMALLPLKGSSGSSFVPSSLRKSSVDMASTTHSRQRRGQLASMPKSAAGVLIRISKYFFDFYLYTKSYDPWLTLFSTFQAPSQRNVLLSDLLI